MESATIGASIMDYDYAVEYSQTWSGGLQYELRSATMAELSYMGPGRLTRTTPRLATRWSPVLEPSSRAARFRS
jgi:hypothetical protein